MNQQFVEKKGLTVKDLVTIGIFSALFLVFTLIGGIFFAPNPVLTFYMPVGSALLCGRSGCGKTTLTRLINGLIPQFFAGDLTGEVLMDGKNIFDMPMHLIAEKVGSVFQPPARSFLMLIPTEKLLSGWKTRPCLPKQ